MKLSFSTLGCPEWDLEKIARKAAEYGFDGVELRAKGRQHVDPELTQAERISIRNLFARNNVEICCLAGYSRFNSDKEEELKRNRDLLLSYVDLAADLGAPFVRTFIGDYSPEITGFTEYDITRNAAKYLNFCGEKAQKKGVKILIETHDSFSLSCKIRKIIDLAQSDGIGVLWDIHHPYRFGEAPGETWENLGKFIQHIHIKDAAENKLYLTGQGNLPITEILSLLKNKGYDGYLSLEWEKMWVKELEEPEIAFPQYIEYMRRLI